MKSRAIVWIWLPAAASSFVVKSRFFSHPSTSVRSSWDNQQQHPDESQGYQQYSAEGQVNQQHFEGDQGYEQYYQQYVNGNQGEQQGFDSQEVQEGYGQYPAQDQGNQQYIGQDQVYQQYSNGNQYQGYDNPGYQQEYTQQEQYGIGNGDESPTENSQEQSAGYQGLILDGLDQEMSRMAPKFSFSESDYLAAARRRAEMRVESSNAGATDEEWLRIANEKKQQLGEIDDWENSAKEAGNKDSHILMFTEPPADGEDDNEPKLLLF